ncbi:hypothetical protein GGP41_007652 [Bipolaris sorokiniana]|uniref:Uncharacterized protein n=1 Tax=Cochliobolus sativus TaxID=45130 RepID=A0A8H5Z6X1_COCSA|nr:hypothetical protein GGP41_007652 [Bipolaris sorokiniana]
MFVYTYLTARLWGTWDKLSVISMIARLFGWRHAKSRHRHTLDGTSNYIVRLDDLGMIQQALGAEPDIPASRLVLERNAVNKVPARTEQEMCWTNHGIRRTSNAHTNRASNHQVLTPSSSSHYKNP